MKKTRFHIPACLIVSLLAVNILSCFLFFRIDMTGNKQYSLSPVSKHIIRNINKDICVELYISNGVTREEAKLGKEFYYLLKEYKSLSNSRFTIHLINPDTEEKRIRAIRQGVEMISHETSELDMVRFRQVFLGAVIRVGDRTAVIPYIKSYTPLEYEITRILKESIGGDKPTVGFVVGHNELKIPSIMQVVNELSTIANIETFYIDPTINLNDYKVICIVGPTDPFHPREIDRIMEYLQQGGRLFIALNHAVGKLSLIPSYGFINRVGLEEMLEHCGAKIGYDFIIDQSCRIVTIEHNKPFLPLAKRFRYPYIPVITNFSKHIITHGLNAVSLEYASSIDPVPTPTAYSFTSLAKTSGLSGTEKVPIILDPMRKWTARDFNYPERTVAALLSNEQNNSAIVLVSDADFMRHNHYSEVRHDNINFAVNSIEWLADDSGLIKLRNKLMANQTIRPVKPFTRIFLQCLNCFLPPVLIALMALIVFHRRKITRLKRSYMD